MSFGASNPATTLGIAVDIASINAMGSQCLPIITSIVTGDSSQIDDIFPLEADILIEQARTILEDIPVHAFKVGILGSIENASFLAEIISDYPEIPLILDPFNTSIPEQANEDADDLRLVISELLIPQARILVINANDLFLLNEAYVGETDVTDVTDEDEGDETEKEAPPSLSKIAIDLIESGCQAILITGHINEQGLTEHLLYEEHGLSLQIPWNESNQVFGINNTLASALAGLLAQEVELHQALAQAHEYTIQCIQNATRTGMGQALPNHNYWIAARPTPTHINTI
jgi:hydroxymethylpyrimidine/phosphomethylpyrimidine kinase